MLPSAPGQAYFELVILTTDSIGANSFFDPRYTCDINNSSPELRWDQIPPGTESFALIAEDPDAELLRASRPGRAGRAALRAGRPTMSVPQEPFAHWVVYGISRDIRHLPAGVPPQDVLPNGIRQGLNSAGKLGYLGPCPAIGDPPHRYYFRIFALRTKLEFDNRLARAQLLDAIRDHVIDSAEFMGRYRRMAQKAG